MVNLESAAQDRALAIAVPGRTRVLLWCGVVAGPVFVVALVVHAVARDGFNLSVQPLSQLSLGDQGWVQIATLIASGILSGAAAIGIRRVLAGGRAGTWGPVLVGVFAVSQLCSGVFLPDPGYGFPPGAPSGAPEQLSWHGTLHVAGVTLGGWALIIACFVFARRFAGAKRPGWMVYCLVTAAADIGLTVVGVGFGDYRLALVGHSLVWLWPSVMAARLISERSAAAQLHAR
jgi:Protein of unknown function (DUF998)